MANNILWRYGVTTVITNAVASLASDTNLLAGYESVVIDNTTDGFEDIILSGKRTTGTSPTASRQIEVWAVAWDSNAWPDVFDGTKIYSTADEWTVGVDIYTQDAEGNPVPIVTVANLSVEDKPASLVAV